MSLFKITYLRNVDRNYFTITLHLFQSAYITHIKCYHD